VPAGQLLSRIQENLMALVKVKMLTSMSGGDSHYRHGEIVEVEEHIATAWIAAGDAIEALEGEAAAAKIEALEKQLDTATLAHADLASLKGQ
jgi:hypothetical protein